MIRLLHYKLLIPFLRSSETTHVVAMGCAIGLFFGLTPTVGVQIPILLILWGIFDRMLKVRFSILVAIAVTWVSNPITMFPLYFGYYKFGLFMFGGKDSDSANYDEFAALLESLISENKGMDIVKALQQLNDIGSYMFMGSLVIATTGAICGYFVGMWLAKKRRAIRSWLLGRRRGGENR